MSESLPPDAMVAPAAARNRAPILDVLRRWLPSRGLVLEIAAGTGEHAVFNAAALPHLQWQPTDPDDLALASIAAWRAHAALPNLLPPLRLDAADPDRWPVSKADAMLNINMIHIAPWAATEGLMSGAGRILPASAVLVLYGPYIESGIETAPSNVAFNSSLKTRNPEWGLRRREAVTALAALHGLEPAERIALPANNLALIFKKR